jgi:hypothetical protein
MPQQDKSHATVGCSELEGKTITPTNREELNEAVRLAFDYRGDVTVNLRDGSAVEGFIFNHDAAAGTIQIFVKEGKESLPRTIRYDDVVSVSFTGEDVAFGKSWSDWQAKSAKQREAEAEKHRQKSLELGHL